MSNDWERVPLRDVAALDIHSITVVADKTYQLAGVLNAGQGMLRRGPLKGADTNYRFLHVLGADQLVMRKLTAWEGPITVVPPAFVGSVVSPEFPTFTLDTSRILPGFMRLVCQRPELWSQMRDRSTGTVQRRKRVSPSQLLQVMILLPSLAEQRRITDLVEATDRAEAAYTQVAATAVQALVSVIDAHEAALPSTDPIRLRSLLEISVGGIWGEEASDVLPGVRVVRSTEFSSAGTLLAGGAIRYLSPSQITSRRLQLGDILLEKSGGGPLQPVGRVVWVGDCHDTTAFSNFIQLVRPHPARLLSRYLFYRMWLWHKLGRTLEYQSQTTGIRNLRTVDYLDQLMAVPALEAQQQFVQRADALDQLAESARLTADAVRILRSGLLDDLLTAQHLISGSYDEFLVGAA